MDSTEERLGSVRALTKHLAQYLGDLPPDAWSRPSACGRWQIRDVVAHLAGGAEAYAGLVSRGLQGDSSPPEGRPPAGTLDASSASDIIAEGAISRRERIGDELLSSFVANSDALSRLFDGVSPDQREMPCYHIPRIMPVRAFVDLRLTELAMHGWDMRSRLEPEAHLPTESLPAFVDVIRRLFDWLFWPPSASPPVARYRFNLTAVGPADIDIFIQGDTARIGTATESVANVTLRCDAETFVFLMYGCLGFDTAITSGRLLVEGDKSLASRLGQCFKGI